MPRRSMPERGSPSPSPALVSDILAAPMVRAEKVAEARALLSGDHWCHAREVADQLVECLVDRRFP